MYFYNYGVVTIVESNFIVLENNKIGYLIYTPNPYSFNIGEEYKVYLYQNVKEDEITLYGFKTKEERELFFAICLSSLEAQTSIPVQASLKESEEEP